MNICLNKKNGIDEIIERLCESLGLEKKPKHGGIEIIFFENTIDIQYKERIRIKRQ